MMAIDHCDGLVARRGRGGGRHTRRPPTDNHQIVAFCFVGHIYFLLVFSERDPTVPRSPEDVLEFTLRFLANSRSILRIDASPQLFR
jgi:hypothetical protein